MMVKWRSWNRQAFSEAKKRKKQVLLSIGTSWCHWCHTMDRETYSDRKVAQYINKKFVPVRVDTDERPDINNRYNVGGWPSTLILMPDGEAVSGATYVPPQQMKGFLEDGLKRAKRYKPVKRKPVTVSSFDVNPNEIHDAVRAYFDPVNGGFGLEPKFLNADILEYLLWRAYALKDAEARKMLDKTFAGMLDGEVFDHVGGGFFRYATQRNWTMPHFEKLLEDNARLVSAYFHGYRLFKRDEYLTAVNKTLFFLFTVLYDHERGVFFGSQDADERFCKLTWEERVKHEWPVVDERVFTDQNAAMALTLFELSTMKPKYAELALRLLEFLCKKAVTGKGVTHVVGKKVFLLRDAVYLLTALLQAYTVTKEPGWKVRTLIVAKFLEEFYDKKEGGFFDVKPKRNAIGRLKLERKPLQENALAVLSLRVLAKLTQKRKYAVMAERTMQAVSAQALALGPRAALYALAKSTGR